MVHIIGVDMKSRCRDSRALRWIKTKIVTARDWYDDKESEVSRTLKPKIGLGAAGKRLNLVSLGRPSRHVVTTRDGLPGETS